MGIRPEGGHLAHGRGREQRVPWAFVAALDFVRQRLAWQGVEAERAYRLIDARRETMDGVRLHHPMPAALTTAQTLHSSRWNPNESESCWPA